MRTLASDLQPPLWSISRFSALLFEPRSGDKTGTPGLIMPGGYWVEKYWLLAALDGFWKTAPTLDRSRRHTAEVLCGDPDWQDRKRGHRIKLGRCIKFCADKHILPVILANPHSQGSRTYFLAADLLAKPTVH